MPATPSQPHLHRRAFAGIAALGIGLPVLAACSGDDRVDVATDPNTPSTSGDGGSPESTRSSSKAPAPDALTSTDDIEVGGGTIFPDEQVVVTQPTDGEFRCFTAVCTHQGCIVSSVSDGDIHCECHGSAFSIADGSVVTGPATSPLAEQQINVAKGSITLA